MKKLILCTVVLLCSLQIFAQDIFTAVKDNDVAGVKFLSTYGININAKDSDGQTPLMLAVTAGNNRIVKLLLQKDAAVDQKDPKGNTALMLACQAGNAEAVYYILSHFPNADAKNKKGVTALMSAVNNGNNEIVKTLLLYGAKPNLKDNMHKTATDYAQASNYMQIKILLDSKS